MEFLSNEYAFLKSQAEYKLNQYQDDIDQQNYVYSTERVRTHGAAFMKPRVCNLGQMTRRLKTQGTAEEGLESDPNLADVLSFNPNKSTSINTTRIWTRNPLHGAASNPMRLSMSSSTRENFFQASKYASGTGSNPSLVGTESQVHTARHDPITIKRLDYHFDEEHPEGYIKEMNRVVD